MSKRLMQKLLQLYKSLICHILEYACAVWQISGAKPLDEVQRKAFCLCLDAYGTTAMPAKSDSDVMLCLQLLSKTLTCRHHLS